jgi:hypothetical protein
MGENGLPLLVRSDICMKTTECLFSENLPKTFLLLAEGKVAITDDTSP